MTIIVYDPKEDRVWVDSGHKGFRFGAKSFLYSETKIVMSPNGHKFTASGTISVAHLAVLVDRALDAHSKEMGVAEIPLDPNETSLVVRLRDGRVLVSQAVGDKIVLVPWDLPFPYARGSGSLFFEAYNLEHNSVDAAFHLTCLHAEGCAAPIELF